MKCIICSSKMNEKVEGYYKCPIEVDNPFGIITASFPHYYKIKPIDRFISEEGIILKSFAIFNMETSYHKYCDIYELIDGKYSKSKFRYNCHLDLSKLIDLYKTGKLLNYIRVYNTFS